MAMLQMVLAVVGLAGGASALLWAIGRIFDCLTLPEGTERGSASVRTLIMCGFLAMGAVRLLWGSGLLR